MRRQALVQKPPAKSPSFRPSGPKPQRKQSQAAAQEAARKRSFFDRILPSYFREVVSELKKVSWPSREETTRLTAVVITVAITMGLLLGGVDIAFNWLVDNTLLR
jgi:preprotein translocase subunit SecE